MIILLFIVVPTLHVARQLFMIVCVCVCASVFEMNNMSPACQWTTLFTLLVPLFKQCLVRGSCPLVMPARGTSSSPTPSASRQLTEGPTKDQFSEEIELNVAEDWKQSVAYIVLSCLVVYFNWAGHRGPQRTRGQTPDSMCANGFCSAKWPECLINTTLVPSR